MYRKKINSILKIIYIIGVALAIIGFILYFGGIYRFSLIIVILASIFCLSGRFFSIPENENIDEANYPKRFLLTLFLILIVMLFRMYRSVL